MVSCDIAGMGVGGGLFLFPLLFLKHIKGQGKQADMFVEAKSETSESRFTLTETEMTGKNAAR